MKRLILALSLLLAACGDDQKAAQGPLPAKMTASAIGHYCGMALVEHDGPKGQIFVGTQEQPFWFSSARDTVAFTLLPEEPKDVRAIYVTDMGKARDWKQPEHDTWIDARQAFYVIESSAKGGMGQAEAVPFGDRAKADEFAKGNGGRVVAFAELPKEYVLGGDTPAVASGAHHAPSDHMPAARDPASQAQSHDAHPPAK